YAGKVTEIGQHALDIQDHLVGQQISVGKNRAVVIVGLVARIVTQRREPITRIKIIISATDQDDDWVTLCPPISRMPFVVTSLLRGLKTHHCRRRSRSVSSSRLSLAMLLLVLLLCLRRLLLLLLW